MPIDKKSGLMVPAVYPCYKGEGLCDLRTVETADFACVFETATCQHRKATGAATEPAEPEAEQGETARMWSTLGRKR